jgi:hypothetical protein
LAPASSHTEDGEHRTGDVAATGMIAAAVSTTPCLLPDIVATPASSSSPRNVQIAKPTNT